jgi:hypothetical protein
VFGSNPIIARTGLPEVALIQYGRLEVLIGVAVAVVIESIADILRGSTRRARAMSRRVLTLPCSVVARNFRTAQTHTSGAGSDTAHLNRRRSRYVFVDLAIAVVIQTITDFLIRDLVAFALTIVWIAVAIDVARHALVGRMGFAPRGATYPVDMPTFRRAIITALFAVFDIGIEIEVGRLRAITVGIDSTGVECCGGCDRPFANHRTTHTS